MFLLLIASHVLRLDMLMVSTLTFVAFSLCASAVYTLNDVSDIQADRQHVRKQRRPFAAAELGIPPGLTFAVASFILLVAAV